MMTKAGAFTTIALACALSSCAAKTAPSSFTSATTGQAARAPRQTQLQRDLSAIFSSATVDHSFWGVSVRSLKTGAVIYSHNPARLQTPASNQKVITSAVAAERLGWDYRYWTKIYSTGQMAGGDLNGDLIVVSNGDPSINPRQADRWGAFDAWAKELYAKGLRRVGGHLIGDDNAFAEPGWGVGWSWDDLVLGYGAAVGALQYNENQIELMIGPGQNAGDRAIISVSPPGSGIILSHAVTTVADGQPSRVSLERLPGSNMLTVSGQMAVGSPAVTEYAAAPNPTILYLSAMREALARNGIFVGGSSLDIDDARVKPDYTTASLLLEDQSPTIGTMIDVCLKWSRNQYAETLLYSVAPTGAEVTASASLSNVRETLTKWGVSPDLYVARDGSGLSRNDYLAPDALIGVLTQMWQDPKHREPFRSALPQAAVSGSLANRMKNTAAAERVWAKTGSMSNVRSLSGYLMTADNEPLVFAFMATGFRVPMSQIDVAIDEALVRLVRYPK
jgi:D-alanyl-D-alanine carboxypeptidase/D-alanyl-D-alanine-endopeptidase (penicillin-binding protein 4)